jgi:ankyrin repeat protein
VGNPELVKKLLDTGCDGLHATVWGETSFFYAVSFEEVEVVDLFLAHKFNGCGINVTSGTACVHVAAQIGSIKMLQKLVSEGEVVTVTDLAGDDALSVAAMGGHVEMIEALREFDIGTNGLGKGRFPHSPW